VFNYLCISTITGRNASVSGHERYFSRQTWVEATSELHESRAERASPTTCPGRNLRADAQRRVTPLVPAFAHAKSQREPAPIFGNFLRRSWRAPAFGASSGSRSTAWFTT
jgi:hypothetical protein